jgi:hypothetical protein
MRRVRYHQVNCLAGTLVYAFWAGFSGRPLPLVTFWAGTRAEAADHQAGRDCRAAVNVSRRCANKWASRRMAEHERMGKRMRGHHTQPSFIGA